METGAYGASLAGGTFDVMNFLQQPQTIVRVLSWLFAIIVFATITAEGYTNPSSHPVSQCMFNGNESACHYGVGIGILAFLACVAFLVVDAYFPQISNAKDRKYIVTADLIFSGSQRQECLALPSRRHQAKEKLTSPVQETDGHHSFSPFLYLPPVSVLTTGVWTFLWFVCFCHLANLWSHTEMENVMADAARAVVAFSFFSTVSWGFLTMFALKRYRQGVPEFGETYTDPANDHTTPYPPYPSSGPESYQQSPFTSQSEPGGEGGYQPPVY
ncbi:hypothetical protein JZ751_027552 [Albula glossodonta]|uniref:Synaptogyrin n=1 Tax=Albula glossodonta TaxID=121402 RepID=A0A8T2NC63_9TELE|nr:hypothetical protein JZ751_027552 [Albula glossodonta]